MIFETDRLIIREMGLGDFCAICGILQDGETMWAYEGAFSDAEVLEWIGRQLCRYREYGFGLWAVVLKATGEVIGQCGLTMQMWNGQEVLEVGYLFNRNYWHHGYATEAARGCIDYAFNVHGATEVCSIIRDSNIASQKVAQRSGMVRTEGVVVKHYRGVDMPHYRYAKVR